MAVESAADLAAFFDPRDFGTTAILWPGTGAARTLQVQFDRHWYAADTDASLAVSSSQPMMLGAETDFDGLAHDDAVQVGGQAWTVFDLQPDGTGVMRVVLGR